MARGYTGRLAPGRFALDRAAAWRPLVAAT